MEVEKTFHSLRYSSYQNHRKNKTEMGDVFFKSLTFLYSSRLGHKKKVFKSEKNILYLKGDNSI